MKHEQGNLDTCSCLSKTTFLLPRACTTRLHAQILSVSNLNFNVRSTSSSPFLNSVHFLLDTFLPSQFLRSLWPHSLYNVCCQHYILYASTAANLSLVVQSSVQENSHHDVGIHQQRVHHHVGICPLHVHHSHHGLYDGFVFQTWQIC